MKAELTSLRGRLDLIGPALRRALVELADRVLRELLGDPGSGVALLAVGGYGRGEPAFGSDLDLLLLHNGRRDDVAALADRVWYPLWDAGMGLDHSVRTIDEAVSVADGDLKAALGLLDARTVGGDPTLAAALLERVRARWRARAARRLPELADLVADRAARHGEVAFLLEPDLKEARGGLRDVHALRALAAAWVADPPAPRVLAAYRVLLDARGELHRRLRGRGRGEDRLLLQEQEAIATALSYDGADALAHAVADAGRTIAWAWDTCWHRASAGLRPTPRWRRRPVRRPLDEDVVEQDGEVQFARDAAPGDDPVLVLRAAAAAARAGLPFGPYALDRLAAEAPPLPTPWPDAARDALVALLGAGPPAVPVLEALDQVGLLVRLLPDWTRVRSKPQRNLYHRFTVDRHLVETAAGAAARTRRVDRPDLLLLGAFLHDLGKGWPGDHVVAGVEAVGRIAPDLGLAPADAEVLVALVRHHLLLSEVATRRDLADPATAERVAKAVRTPQMLGLLQALTEADSLATGPTAWSPWKARLVTELVARAGAVLGGTPAPRPPALTAAQRELLARTDGMHVLTRPLRDEAYEIVVTAPDRVGLLAAATGVLATHRLDVRRAQARSADGRALIELAVAAPHGGPPEPARLRADLAAVLDGRCDLAARLARREQAYTSARRGPPPAAPRVWFDDGAESTVVEVRAPDGVGVLHRIVRTLSGAGLDVRTAIVATLGLDVVDAFYVRGSDGGPVRDAGRRSAIADAVLGALAPPVEGRG